MSVGFMARLDAGATGAGIIASAGSATAESGVMAAGDTDTDTSASNGERLKREPGRRRLVGKSAPVTSVGPRPGTWRCGGWSLTEENDEGHPRKNGRCRRARCHYSIDRLIAQWLRATIFADSEVDAQAFLHLGAKTAAHRHRGAVAQEDLEVAVRRGLELAHAVDVDDRAAVHAQEALRREPRLHVGERAAQQMAFRPDVQTHVVV